MLKTSIIIFLTINILYLIKKINFIKNESLKNKIEFINTYNNSEICNYEYMTANYKHIMKNIEAKYPLKDYINKQDRLYSYCLFTEDKSSLKYQYSLLGKYDIAKIKQEIEFEILKECFVNIYKKIQEDKKNDFLSKNKILIILFKNNIIYTKKIYFLYKLIIFMLIFQSIILFFY